MADILTPEQRSALMARVRSAGNASTELRLVALLRAARITGWRRGCRLCLPGAGGCVQGLEFRVQGAGFRVSGRRVGAVASVPAAADIAGRDACATKDRSCGQRPATGHRLPVTGLTVRPDFVFRRQRLAVFVDGCFWHGCPRHYTRPKARRAFWETKIAANRARDRRIDRALRAAGWRVLHVWEHALAPRAVASTLARVRRALLVV